MDGGWLELVLLCRIALEGLRRTCEYVAYFGPYGFGGRKRGYGDVWSEYSAGGAEEDDGRLLTELELGREGEGRDRDLGREGKND